MTFLSNAGRDYTIHTEIYTGPLDLLLDLINKAELDITKLSLASVTDQYLAHLDTITLFSATEVSGFLVVAAKLIQIKSEVLLPRPPERSEDEDDPAESLARQLRLYKAVREAAEWLQALESKGQRTYIRLAPPPVIDEQLDLGDIGIDDLVNLIKSLYLFEEDAAPITTVVAIPKVTLKNKIKDILHDLRNETNLSYQQLLPENYSRIEAIILFLAVLELVKQNYAIANQDSLFADILISSTDRIFDDEELTLALDE